MGNTVTVFTSMEQMYQFSEVILINLISHMLDAFLFMYFVQKFFWTKNKKYDHFWMFGGGLMTLILWLGDWLSGNNLECWMFLLFCIPFLFLFIFYQGSWNRKVIICSVIYTILISLEFLGSGLFYLIKSYIEIRYSLFLLIYIIGRILLKLLFLLVIKFLLRYTMRESDHWIQKYWNVIGSICVVEFVILYIFRYHQSEDSETLIFHLMLDDFCFIIPILLYYIVNFMGENVRRIQVETSQKRFIENQELYLSQILTMQNSLKQFRHDYKAHLFCIDSLLQEKNYEELHAYLERIHEMEFYPEYFLQFSGDSRLNIILNQKYMTAKEKGIHFDIIVKELLLKKISFYDLNMLLSNLCDNAIEAAEKTEEKSVELRMREERAYLQLTIKNSTKGNVLEDNPSFLTNKQEKEFHGLGMQIIQNIVEKYQGTMQFEGEKGWLKINILLLDEGNLE